MFFCGFLMYLHSSGDSVVANCVEEISAADEALAQCIDCLYGVRLGVAGLESHEASGKAKPSR
jgi:hypothetical protein